jgi:hypothetical protein
MLGARLVMNAGPAGPGMVNLPHMMQDSSGNNYRIYQGGWFQQQNNMPQYSQGAMLSIDGQNPAATNNSAKLDAKTGDLIIENMQGGACTVTRYIHLDRAGGYIRYIDVFKNTQNTPKTFQVMIQSTCNYGINTGQSVPDPKKKDQSMGWVGQTGANQSVVEMFAGRGAKVAPQVTWPQGNNQVQATVPLTLAPGKEAAVMHMHMVAPTQDAGMRFITDFKEAPLLKEIPPPLRKLIINFRSAQDFIGDLEVLRGDSLDIVELRGGDAFKGTLKETAYELDTFYGHVTLPVEKVIGIINIGQFRPRQLMVTGDGQIIGGYLKKQTLELEMSSGQTTQIPLSQVSRVGYRKRPGEPEEWTFDKPMILLRSGERILVQMPKDPLEVVTRYGKVLLKPEQLAAVQLQTEDTAVHQIELTDGSRFAGLLTADVFTMQLDLGATTQEVKIPLSNLTRLQLTPKVKEADDITPTIRLSNDDQMVGTLTGQLKMNTAFDTLTINGPELKSLIHVPDGGAQDISISLWDGTTFSGQVEEQLLSCQLLSGLTLNLPVALVQEYNQPQPRPSAATIARIKELVDKELTNEDFHVRDHARHQLIGMGQVAAPILKEIRENQPPEAQKSIDVVLSELEKQRKPPKAAAVAPVDPDQ